MDIGGVPVVYNVANKELLVDGVKAPVSLIDDKLKTGNLYGPHTPLNICNDGLVFIPVNINLEDANRSLSLSAKGGTVKVNNIDVYALKSIWD